MKKIFSLIYATAVVAAYGYFTHKWLKEYRKAEDEKSQRVAEAKVILSAMEKITSPETEIEDGREEDE